MAGRRVAAASVALAAGVRADSYTQQFQQTQLIPVVCIILLAAVILVVDTVRRIYVERDW